MDLWPKRNLFYYFCFSFTFNNLRPWSPFLSKAVTYRCFSRKMLLEMFTKFRLKFCNFIKKQTSVKVFSCYFCKFLRVTLLAEHLWATASLLSNGNHFQRSRALKWNGYWKLAAWIFNKPIDPTGQIVKINVATNRSVFRTQ